ncbi:MAG: AmmeMemoRadiSam system radical SAM enzyme [Candidatus Cloacimonetes bacterium]|nr:AmmeMemoRadiSam system radical SAM enzyme [Candidatus Cloacimonadota bacterium]
MAEMKREAMYYNKIRKGLLQCQLCPHYCIIRAGEKGLCRSRENIDGKLWAVNYAQAIGLSLDPIEKKPLYHFRPGSRIVSLGPNSCNMTCRFCQNYSISQYESPTHEINIDDLYQVIEGKGSPLQVAFTYTEPFTWYEYIHDFATKYPQVDIVLITNGFINPGPLDEILPMLRAINIDLKSFREEFYAQECGAKLKQVMQCINRCWESGVHLEVTTLLIPGLNDSSAEIHDISSFLASINRNIPLHLSAYHPDFKMDLPPTSADDVLRAVEIVKENLNYVYGGNIPLEDAMHSYCPACGSRVIERGWHRIVNRLTTEAKCPDCGFKIPGVYV